MNTKQPSYADIQQAAEQARKQTEQTALALTVSRARIEAILATTALLLAQNAQYTTR